MGFASITRFCQFKPKRWLIHLRYLGAFPWVFAGVLRFSMGKIGHVQRNAKGNITGVEIHSLLDDEPPEPRICLIANPKPEPKRQRRAATMPDDPSVPLSAKQAAERMNISERKVYQLCQQGLLRHTNSPIRILPADIDRYRESTQQGTTLRHLR